MPDENDIITPELRTAAEAALPGVFGPGCESIPGIEAMLGPDRTMVLKLGAGELRTVPGVLGE